MKKKSAKQTVRGSLRATRDLVSQIGGKLTPASGAWLEKGDGRVPGMFRIETKCPPTGKYRLYRKDWDILWRAAVRGHEVPVFHIKLSPGVELAILRDTDYRGMEGPSVAVGMLEATENSWAIDADTWAGYVSKSQTHWYLPFSKLLLRVMPLHDFIKLANAQRNA